MMIRKDPKFELESSRKVFFQLGLFIVGSATLLAFTYKTPVYLNAKEEISQREVDIPIEFLEKEVIPPIEIPEVEKLPTNEKASTSVFLTDLLNKTNTSKNKDEDQKLAVTTLGSDFFQTGSFEVDLGASPKGVLVEFPEIDAKFQGSWLGYLRNSVKYPEESIIFKESGTAWVSFIVEIDGTVTDVEVKNKNLPKNLQKEAIRVVKSSPRWKPGSKNGEFVRSTKTVKINFILK